MRAPCKLGVHRDAIRVHSRETYDTLLGMTLDARPVQFLDGCRPGYGDTIQDKATLNAHGFERMWPSIFGMGSSDVECIGPSLDPGTTLIPGALQGISPPGIQPYFHSLVCRKAHLRDETERALTQTRAELAYIPMKLESTLIEAIRSTLNHQSSCVPDGAIMVSLANEYHAELRELALRSIGTHRCLLDRFVSLCFGFDDGIGTCVRVKAVAPGAFSSERYHRLLWTKWHLLRIASSMATHVFYADADVVLLHNPWPALMHTATHVPGYDALFQAEGLCSSCGSGACPHVGRNCVGVAGVCALKVTVSRSGTSMCPMNGGQLLVARDSRLVRRMLHLQPCFRAGQRDLPLDQLIADALRHDDGLGLRTCALPTTFSSHCWWKFAGRSSSELSTWHANCITSKFEKKIHMRSMSNITQQHITHKQQRR
jgi:hypothetical protein